MNFAWRDYFKKAGRDTAYVGKPYLSQNDGRYKVSVAAKVVDSLWDIGVLVVSVSTPGTKALDDQRSFIRDLYIAAGVSSSPLALFIVAAVLVWLWPRLSRPVAADRA